MAPSFFKILLDSTAPHLPLPPEFVTRHLKNTIPKHPIIRPVLGSFSWRVKIKKIGEDYCFTDGWSNVVAETGLGFGDFLVFRMCGKSKSVFKMLVYSPNGCVKDVPTVVQVDNDSTVVNDVIDEDDDDEVEVDDEGEEVEVDEEGEGVDEDEEDDDDDEEEEDEYYEEEKDEGDDEEDDGEDDGGGDIDGHDGDPFFMSVISKSQKNTLRLPAEFVALAGIHGEGTLIVKNRDDKEWKLGVRVEKQSQSERYSLSAGWPEFQRNNDLRDGDECVFKYVRSEEKLLLARVTNRKGGGRHPPPTGKTPVTKKHVKRNGARNSGGVSGSEAGKRARDRGGRRGVDNENVGKRTRARLGVNSRRR